MEETFRQQLRKKVIDLKPEISGSYTELYNLVTVMFKLTPDAFDEKTIAQEAQRRFTEITYCAYLVGFKEGSGKQEPKTFNDFCKWIKQIHEEGMQLWKKPSGSN